MIIPIIMDVVIMIVDEHIDIHQFYRDETVEY